MIIPPVLLVLYWLVLIGTFVASGVLSVLAWRDRTRIFLYLAAGLLALSLMLAAVPMADPGFAVLLIVTVTAIIVAVAGGGPAAALVLAMASRGSVQNGSHGGIIGDNGEVLRGGTTIGLLERLAVIGALLAGFPEGLAVVVAVKGVGRFSELDSAETRERFIIGSLVSLIWACTAAGVVLLARA